MAEIDDLISRAEARAALHEWWTHRYQVGVSPMDVIDGVKAQQKPECAAAFTRIEKYIEEAVGDFCHPLHADLADIHAALRGEDGASIDYEQAVKDYEEDAHE